jgi:succinyl-CoA synthetase beta subunit
VEKGKQMLADSGLKITPADDMDDAAEKIVQLVK